MVETKTMAEYKEFGAVGFVKNLAELSAQNKAVIAEEFDEILEKFKAEKHITSSQLKEQMLGYVEANLCKCGMAVLNLVDAVDYAVAGAESQISDMTLMSDLNNLFNHLKAVSEHCGINTKIAAENVMHAIDYASERDRKNVKTELQLFVIPPIRGKLRECVEFYGNSGP